MTRRRCALVVLGFAAVFAGSGPGWAAKKKPADHRTPHDFAYDPAPSTYRPMPRADTLITNGIVLDGAGQRIDEGDVLVRDGRIVAVGRDLTAEPNVTIIDARGRWVTPGIIDVHSHNGTFSAPLTAIDQHSSDLSELATLNSADTWVEHAINVQDPSFFRALTGGVTTLQVLPGSSPLFGGRSVVLKTVPALTVQGMKFPAARHGLKMACGENPKSQGASKGSGPTSRQGSAAMVRTAFSNAGDYARKWNKYTTGEASEPPQTDLKLETLAAVLNQSIDVHFHCYRADDMAVMMNIASEFGVRIAAFHHAEEGYKIPSQLRAAGICSAVWSDWWGFKMEAIDGIRENAAFIDAAGACTIMHSDSPQVGQRLNIEAAKAAAAGRRAGLTLPPEHVIRWITSNPAKALMLGDRIGTLAAGYNADLVIWSADPFSIYARADTVLIDGAIAFDRRDSRYQPQSDFEVGWHAAEQLP